mgnify:CR=1 FL=1
MQLAHFAPARFQDRVVFRWYYDDPEEGWVEHNVFKTGISGGREQGFRTAMAEADVDWIDWRPSVRQAAPASLRRPNSVISRPSSPRVMAAAGNQTAALYFTRAVVFAGRVPHAGLRDFYAALDIFVLPSRIASDGDRDGLPNVLMEAASQELTFLLSSPLAEAEIVEATPTATETAETDEETATATSTPISTATPLPSPTATPTPTP